MKKILILEIAAIATAGKLMGAGLGAISFIGAGIGIGVVFSGFMIASALKPQKEKDFFTYALMGFALSEATLLFGLLIIILILFSF